MKLVVEVEVLQGQREIGGNCVKIRDGDKKLLFDQGLRFSLFKKFYGARLRPSGPMELREIGVLPPYGELEDVDALYVTHYHLDHLGLLGDLPSGLEVRVPSRLGLTLLEEWYRDSPDWLAYIPPRYDLQVQEAEPLVHDVNDVIALPISHSAYPASSYLYLGSDETVLYTGDFRFESFSRVGEEGRGFFEFFERESDMRVDKLIIEGTNIGKPVTPLGKDELINILRRVFSLNAPLLIALHRLELDLLAFILDEVKAFGRHAILASSKLLDVLEAWAPGLGIPLDNVSRPLSLADKVSRIHLISPDEIRDLSKFVVIADLLDLVDFARAIPSELSLKGGFALLMLSEHESEEATEEAVALRWLGRLGVQTYRLRVSGHYYPHELVKLFKLVKPREVIPVHTEAPELLIDLWKSLK